MGRRSSRPIRIPASIARLNDEDLAAYRRGLAGVTTRYAADRYLAALSEEIRREEA